MYTEWPDKQPLCSLLTCSHTFNLQDAESEDQKEKVCMNCKWHY